MLSKSLVLSGSSREESWIVSEKVFFPHRGFWKLKAISFTLQDSLGLSSTSWQKPLDLEVEISAPELAIKPLPLVAASTSAGDEMQFAKERSGDLFDIKAYDPSDGVSRILWKTFAHSGQLVVRRPEPAVLPEGEVAVYVIAKRSEEEVISSALSYINYLDDRRVSILFGTDGAEDASIQGTLYPRDIQRAINRSVWSEQTGSGHGYANYLEQLEYGGRKILETIVFASEDLPKDTLSSLLEAAHNNHCALSLALVPKKLANYLPQMPSEKDPLKKPKRTSTETAHILKEMGAKVFVCELSELTAWRSS